MKTLEEQVLPIVEKLMDAILIPDIFDSSILEIAGDTEEVRSEFKTVVEQALLTAEKRGAEREREATRPEKFNIPRIIKRGTTESEFRITREESIYGYDLWRGHYIELGRSSGGFRDILDTLRSCEEVAERLLDEDAEDITQPNHE